MPMHVLTPFDMGYKTTTSSTSVGHVCSYRLLKWFRFRFRSVLSIVSVGRRRTEAILTHFSPVQSIIFHWTMLCFFHTHECFQMVPQSSWFFSVTSSGVYNSRHPNKDIHSIRNRTMMSSYHSLLMNQRPPLLRYVLSFYLVNASYCDKMNTGIVNMMLLNDDCTWNAILVQVPVVIDLFGFRIDSILSHCVYIVYTIFFFTHVTGVDEYVIDVVTNGRDKMVVFQKNLQFWEHETMQFFHRWRQNSTPRIIGASMFLVRMCYPVCFGSNLYTHEMTHEWRLQSYNYNKSQWRPGWFDMFVIPLPFFLSTQVGVDCVRSRKRIPDVRRWQGT
jgi:hypothetical protein